MNNQARNFICYDRRKAPRREPGNLLSYTAVFEPNPFSRRGGAERRETMAVNRTYSQAS